MSVFDASFAGTCHSDKKAQPEIAEGRDVKWLRTKKNMHVEQKKKMVLELAGVVTDDATGQVVKVRQHVPGL